jgi:hypothetical protein
MTFSLHQCSVVSSFVREVVTPDGAVLLDIKQGSCFSVTPIGALIWSRLTLGESDEQIIAYLADAFPDTPVSQVREDFCQFLAHLRRKGLLRSDHSGSPAGFPRLLFFFRPNPHTRANVGSAPRSPRFLVWKALLGLLIFDLCGFSSHFDRIHACLRQWPLSPGWMPYEHNKPLVEEICWAVNQACAWYPKRVLCLQRSAVTTCLMRNCGIPAQTVIGAQKLPFKAHAWTEIEGNVVNERRNVQEIYLVWERC